MPPKKLRHRFRTGTVIVSDTITPSTAANPAPPNHSAAANGTIPIEPMKLKTPASTPTAAFSSTPRNVSDGKNTVANSFAGTNATMNPAIKKP